MSDPKKDPRRIIGGQRVHRDVDWNYSFLRPSEWIRYDLQDQYGFIYAPGDDPRTGFYITARDMSGELDERVTEADLPALREGMMDGLTELPDCKILQEKEINKDWAIGFEVVLTFTLDGETAKRRMWLLFNDRQQFTLYGQGVPVYEYEVFHGKFQSIYDTFTFGDIFRTLTGMPTNPEVVVSWNGGGEDVQAKPLHPRDDVALIRERISKLKEEEDGE